MSVTPTYIPTPTPIPMDNVPTEFQNYIFQMFIHIFQGLKNIEIPFTSVTVYDVLLGTIAVSAVTLALKLMYGKGGESTHHE